MLVLVNALVGSHVRHRRHVPDRKSRYFTSMSIPRFTNHISTTCIHGRRMSTARTTQLCHNMSRRAEMQSLKPWHLPSRPTNPERCRHPQRSHPSDLFKPSINATPPQRTSRPFSKLLKHAGHWHWNGQLLAVVVVKNTRSMLICIARRSYRQGKQKKRWTARLRLRVHALLPFKLPIPLMHRGEEQASHARIAPGALPLKVSGR